MARPITSLLPKSRQTRLIIMILAVALPKVGHGVPKPLTVDKAKAVVEDTMAAELDWVTARDVAVMLLLYGAALLYDPLLPNPVYFLVVAVTVCTVTLMVYTLAGRLRRMALHDPLTRVLNRRGLEVMSDVVAAQAGRSDTPVSLVIIDLDKFKQFNDSAGHVAGDQRLIDIAQAWATQVRGSEIGRAHV